MKTSVRISCAALACAAGLALFFPSCAKSAKTVTVGSKSFTEQLIIGNIMARLLESNGFAVKKQFGTGSTITREGLETGQTDLYAEYTGTAWIVYMKKTESDTDPESLYEKVKAEDAKRDIVWLDRIPLNNTYALAVKKDMASTYGTSISSLAEYARTHPGRLRFGIGHEFQQRPDGFQSMIKTYGLDISPEQVSTMDVGLSYEALNRGQVDVAMVFTTDGLLVKYDLLVLKDDRSFFPVYNLAVTVRKETLAKYPEIEKILKPLAGLLDNATMQQLNFKVDGEGLPPEKVAEDFLREHKLIK